MHLLPPQQRAGMPHSLAIAKMRLAVEEQLELPLLVAEVQPKLRPVAVVVSQWLEEGRLPPRRSCFWHVMHATTVDWKMQKYMLQELLLCLLLRNFVRLALFLQRYGRCVVLLRVVVEAHRQLQVAPNGFLLQQLLEQEGWGLLLELRVDCGVQQCAC